MDFLSILFVAFPPTLVHLATVAYLGPDSVLPLASVLAAVIGVFLMFGRYILGAFRSGFHALRRKDSTIDASPPRPDEKS
jgi:ABC-type amino acid transport system permease subunit